jgi:hypothetical protein
MMRALPKIAFAALALAGASCQPVLVSEDGEPIVGRLQFQDRLVDLTVDSFADGPQAVPSGSFAEVMADIDLPEREHERDPTDDGAERSRPSLERR